MLTLNHRPSYLDVQVYDYLHILLCGTAWYKIKTYTLLGKAENHLLNIPRDRAVLLCFAV